MTALRQAIDASRPADSLDAESPLAGLRRKTVTTVDLVAQSVAAVAPAGVLILHPGGLHAHGGSFAALELVITASIIVLVAFAISLFARRIAAAGSLYTFVTMSLGSQAGTITGLALGLGYACLAIGSLQGMAGALNGLIATATAGHAAADPGERPEWVTVGLMLIIGTGICAVVVRGARPSTRVMLIVELVAVVVILALSIVVLVANGWDLGRLVPDFTHAPSITSIAGGVGIGFIAFVGFESGVALGPESPRPLATVPRALRWTIGTVVVVYLFGMMAQFSAAPAATSHGNFLQEGLAVLGASSADSGINAILAASLAACTLASTTALVRLVFSMSREGVLPRRLGATSPRFGTPHRAAVAVVGAIVATSIVAVILGRGSLLSAITGLGGTTGFVVAYLLLCIAAPFFLRRLGEFTLGAAVAPSLGALGLAVVLLAQLVSLDGMRTIAAVVILLLGTAIVLLHRRRLTRHPEIVAKLGLYDSPTASDGLAGTDSLQHGVER